MDGGRGRLVFRTRRGFWWTTASYFPFPDLRGVYTVVRVRSPHVMLTDKKLHKQGPVMVCKTESLKVVMKNSMISEIRLGMLVGEGQE